MRNIRLVATALAVSAGLLTTTAVSTAAGNEGAAGATAAACAVDWGSLPETADGSGSRPLTNVRTGRHDCYDRMVLDVRGNSSTEPVGHHVRYVDRFRQDGSGRPLTVNGGAVLEVVAHAPAYDPETFAPTYAGRGGLTLPGVRLTGYRTFRDARFGASYEGTTQIGLGVRARLPFRVLHLSDRLVIDVAHSWAAR
jgi:hypothetical protein